MPVTYKQKKELNKAILEYLRDNDYTQTLDAFKQECKEDLPEKQLKILERKWTAVVRLTLKVQQLESKLNETENELKVAKPFDYNSFKGPKKLFDELLPNKQRFHMKGHQKAINCVVFHPNFSWLVTCADDSRIGVWDYESGKLEKWLRGHTNSVCDLAFNANGTYLASSSTDMSVKIWNFEDEFRCEKTLNGHDHAVSGVRFLRHDSNLLLSCSRDGSVKIWELDSGYCKTTLSDIHDGEWVKRLDVSYDGSLLATCSVDQTIRVLDVHKEYREIGVYRGHEHVVECIRFTNPNTDQVIMRDALRGQRSRDDDSTSESDSESESDSDNESGGGRNMVNTNKAEKKLKPPRFIASASRDKSIMIWDIRNVECVMKLAGHENWVRSLAFHPAGRFLFSSADDKSVRCWDLSKRRLYSKIDACHSGFVSAIDWHPSESLLASVSTSKDIKIWAHDKHHHHHKHHHSNGSKMDEKSQSQAMLDAPVHPTEVVEDF